MKGTSDSLNRVFAQVCACCYSCIIFLFACVYRCIIKIVYKCVNAAAEIAFNCSKESRMVFCINLLLVDCNHAFCKLAVCRNRVIFKETCHAASFCAYRGLDKLNSRKCLVQISVNVCVLCSLLNSVVDCLNCCAVFLNTFRICCNPLVECLLLCSPALNDVQLVKGLVHAHPFLPAVRRTCIFARVLDSHFRICKHVVHPDILFLATYKDADCVVDLLGLFSLLAAHKAGSSARETYDHCKIILLNTFQRDFQRLFWSVRNVLLRVLCRVVVLVCIDSEYREVTCMSRPHPVVGISTELSD